MGLAAKLLLGLAVAGGGYFAYMNSQQATPRVVEKALNKAEAGLDKAQDVAGQAKDKANAGIDKAKDKINAGVSKAQDKIQEKKEQVQNDKKDQAKKD